MRLFSLAAATLALAGPAAAASSGGFVLEAYSGPSTGVGVLPGYSAVALLDLVVPTVNISSWALVGDSNNVKLVFDVVPGALVDLISWDVVLTSLGGSFRSEMAVTFTNSSNQGVRLRPGVGDASAGGPTAYTGSASLVATGQSFNIGADGKLRLEFHEVFDDGVDQVDGIWNGGSLTFSAIAVPEPATYGLMALGLLAVGAAARRQKVPA